MSARRLAGLLILVACRSLPAPERDDRRREWTAEVAAILDDPGTRSRTRRDIRALLFAADHIRGARRLAGRAPVPSTALGAALLAAGPLSGLGIATIAGLLPSAHPVWLARTVLILLAGMTYQIIHERRRYWPPASNDELRAARFRMAMIVYLWLVEVAGVLTHGLGRWAQTTCSLGIGITLLLVSWWIRKAPGIPPDRTS